MHPPKLDLLWLWIMFDILVLNLYAKLQGSKRNQISTWNVIENPEKIQKLKKGSKLATFYFTYNRFSTFHISTFRPAISVLLTASAAWSSYHIYAAYLKISSAMPSIMSDLSFGVEISSIPQLLNSEVCQLSEAEFQLNITGTTKTWGQELFFTQET